MSFADHVAALAHVPPLRDISADQRRELEAELAAAESVEDLPGKWQWAVLEAERRANVAVRMATTDDIGTVLGIWAQARSAVAATVDTPEAVERVIEAGALLVAEVAGELVGTLIAANDGWRGNMYRLAVLPEHRRAGIAGRLVDEGERLLRGRGINRITALVGREEEHAGALWRAVGYAYDERVVRYVKDI